MKTAELTGAALDWAVAKCECGDDISEIDDPHFYSTDWTQGGPIIEREKIGVWWATPLVDYEGNVYGNHWYAEPGMTDENADKPYASTTGPTPLIAAMRCYVANKLGEEVDIPEELMEVIK